MREIKFSLLYRDMWQSSGKYVPTVEQLTEVAPAIIEMGCFARVETNGGGFEQINLLFGENPNKAVREWTQPFNDAGIQTHMLERGLNGIRMTPVPDDVRRLMFQVKKKQGTDIARSFDGLNDPRNLKHVLETIHKHRATFLPGVPTLFLALSNYPEVGRYDLSSVRACISGGATLSRETKERFESLTGGTVIEGYGLSEASPVTHANPVHGGGVVGAIGLPWPDVDCKIVDLEDGETELAQGETGELWVRGPQVMKGYWQQPEETAKVLQDGWLRTGDIASMDERGYFVLHARKKDLIIAGGYKIFPSEIEEALQPHPHIAEVAAVGVPHPYRGETVKVFVVRKPGAALSEGEVVAWCRERLARYKVPTAVEFRDELPRNPIGKVLRRLLVAPAEPVAGAGVAGAGAPPA